MKCQVAVIFLACYVQAQNNFLEKLSQCKKREPNFDACLKDVANVLRSEFKTGIPEMKIPPFDPFYIKEVSTSRLNVKLTLRNVYERGWSTSKVTGLRTNLEANTLMYHQWFPEKYLDGEYEIETNLVTPFANQGKFNLSLYNYTQVTEVTWMKPGEPFKVVIKALDCGDLKLHMTNLAYGRRLIEAMLDRIINAAWRPGFNMLKPVIDDLVSTAFSKIFNEAFGHLAFDKIIRE